MGNTSQKQTSHGLENIIWEKPTQSIPESMKDWSAKDEAEFRAWYKPIAKQMGLDTNPDNPLHYYDYRAAYKAGATPDETGHWPSEFKKEGHPRMIVDGINTKTGEVANWTDTMVSRAKKIPGYTMEELKDIGKELSTVWGNIGFEGKDEEEFAGPLASAIGVPVEVLRLGFTALRTAFAPVNAYSRAMFEEPYTDLLVKHGMDKRYAQAIARTYAFLPYIMQPEMMGGRTAMAGVKRTPGFTAAEESGKYAGVKAKPRTLERQRQELLDTLQSTVGQRKWDEMERSAAIQRRAEHAEARSDIGGEQLRAKLTEEEKLSNIIPPEEPTIPYQYEGISENIIWEEPTTGKPIVQPEIAKQSVGAELNKPPNVHENLLFKKNERLQNVNKPIPAEPVVPPTSMKPPEVTPQVTPEVVKPTAGGKPTTDIGAEVNPEVSIKEPTRVARKVGLKRPKLKMNIIAPEIPEAIDKAIPNALDVSAEHLKQINDVNTNPYSTVNGRELLKELKDTYGVVNIKSPSGKFNFDIINTKYHLENFRNNIAAQQGKRGGITLNMGLGGAQPLLDKATKRVAEQVEDWKLKSKIPFVTHREPPVKIDNPQFALSADEALGKQMDTLGIKGERRTALMGNLFGNLGINSQDYALNKLSNNQKVALRNFLQNADTDVYGKAVLADIADNRGVMLDPKFVDNVESLRDLPKGSGESIEIFRAAPYVDPTMTLWKKTGAPYETANHLIREEKKAKEMVISKLLPGIREGSKLSSMLQNFIEKKLPLEQVPQRYRQMFAKADQHFRAEYDDLLGRINEARAMVNKAPINRRDDYFTHTQQLGILSLMHGGLDRIPNEVLKIIEKTHAIAPRFKYEERLGAEYVSDAVGNYFKYLNNALNVIHFTPVMVEAKAYVRHLPPRAFKYFSTWMDETLAGRKSHWDRGMEESFRYGEQALKTWSWIRRRTVANIIRFSARMVVQQPSSYALTFNGLATGPARGVADVAMNVTDAIAPLFTYWTKEGRALTELSPEMQNRAWVEHIDPTTLNKLDRALDYMNAHADRMQVGFSFLGKYRQLVRQGGMSFEDMVMQADLFAKRTQASYQKGMLPPILRSELGKNILPLQTFTFNAMHQMGWDVKRIIAERGKAAAFAYGLGAYASMVAINQVYATLHMAPTWDFMSFIPGLGYIKYGAPSGINFMYSLLKYWTGDESDKSMKKILTRMAYQIIPPFGGEQIRKSIDGYLTASKPGHKPYRLRDDVDRVCAILFGPSSTMAGREYFNKRDKALYNRAWQKLKKYANAEQEGGLETGTVEQGEMSTGELTTGTLGQ
jgi:hypothetical protein